MNDKPDQLPEPDAAASAPEDARAATMSEPEALPAASAPAPAAERRQDLLGHRGALVGAAAALALVAGIGGFTIGHAVADDGPEVQVGRFAGPHPAGEGGPGGAGSRGDGPRG